MNNYIPILKRTQLFSGVLDKELSAMLGCLQARKVSYKKGEYIIRQGEHINSITVLVDGKLIVQCDDFWGNRSIINIINVGEMFGECYVAPESGAVLNDVIADKDSTVLFFDVQKILTVCPTACNFHSMVVRNLFYSISDKNQKLVQKICYMSKRTTRNKLLSYLSEESKRNNSNSFTIPYNRQQLADYLAVDRSAMSNELCKMRDEGLIEFDKNYFKLIDID